MSRKDVNQYKICFLFQLITELRKIRRQNWRIKLVKISDEFNTNLSETVCDMAYFFPPSFHIGFLPHLYQFIHTYVVFLYDLSAFLQYLELLNWLFSHSVIYVG